MAEDYQGAGSEITVPAAQQSLDELTAMDLMALPTRAARPSWMLTRYPVSMDEFARLNEEAKRPDPTPQAAFADETLDVDVEAALAVDVPEDTPDALGPSTLAPPIGASFEGIPATGWIPPDCTIAVGPNHVLLGVNTDLAGYSKTGQLLFRWNNMTTLFKNVLPSGATIFDPVMAYDHYANRFVVVVAARRDSPAGSWLLVAASQTNDPGGTWWVWALDARLDGGTLTNNWADYPMLGFDTQAIYISLNMFQIGGGYQYPKIRILNKSQLYSGAALGWYDFWNLKDPSGAVAFTVQPACHFRGTGGNPPAYLINALWPSGNSLTLWTLSNPLGSWTGGTPSLSKRAVACRSYDLPPDAEQAGGTNRIETNDSRLLKAIFQNAGGVQRLWTCHTSKITWSGESEARCAVQWYEIDVTSGNIVQQNAFGATSAYYFFPAIQTDTSRNAYLVFSRSRSTEFGHLRQTGRRVGDPPNDLQSSALVKAGASNYPRNRWGDYFGIGRDPADPGRVWGYGEYAAAGGNWGTWVCSMKF
jgi:hypothetical protein